ncbi:MAG: hypothetical protein ACI8RP_000009 [Urechidicola sp.]|jgi:hypothetical protein|tara:strand:+ start:2136 stop:3854 length:1719 start_codon:yes stop_codon:yes gene_type:complete
MKLKTYFLTFILVVAFACCEDENNDTAGTGIIDFKISEISEVENATNSLTLNIGIDNYNHSGGSVDVSISGAIYGADYETSTGNSSFTLEISENTLVSGFSIIPIDNNILDGNKTLTITLSNAVGALELGENITFNYHIIDNEEPIISILNFQNTVYEIQENDANTTMINVDFDLPTTDGGTIDVTSSGDAVFGTDFAIDGQTSSNFTITVPAGATSTSFDISPIDNADFAANKSVIFTLLSVDGGLSLGALVETEVTVINDDASPSKLIDFNTGNVISINEDAGMLTVTFDLSGVTIDDATVELTATGTATSGSDYTFDGSSTNPYIFTVLAGSSTATLEIPITDDTDIESDETVTLELTNATGGLEVGVNNTQYIFTITDNDFMPFNYVETFETASDLAGIGYEILFATQNLPTSRLLKYNNNAGKYSDVDDVNADSDSGIVIFYKNDFDGNGVIDNMLVSPIMGVTGDVTVSFDVAFEQTSTFNNADVKFYYSETYNGSETWTASDWIEMGSETALLMEGEGFGIGDYKRKEMSINPTASFYVAVRVNQTIDDTYWKTQWRFDNIKVLN